MVHLVSCSQDEKIEVGTDVITDCLESFIPQKILWEANLLAMRTRDVEEKILDVPDLCLSCKAIAYLKKFPPEKIIAFN